MPAASVGRGRRCAYQSCARCMSRKSNSRVRYRTRQRPKPLPERSDAPPVQESCPTAVLASPRVYQRSAARTSAVLEEIERLGPNGFSKDVVVRRFLDRAGKSNLYRWLDEVIASGRPGQHLARVVKEAAAKRAETSPDPARAAAEEVATKLPVVVSPGEIAGTGTVNVINKLQECIKTAEDAHASLPDA
jgi:hypothetical protein